MSELDEAKAAEKKELAASRYAEETGGVVFNGVRMHTDRDSQAKYTGAVLTYRETGQFVPV